MLHLCINLLLCYLVTLTPTKSNGDGEGGPPATWWNPDFQEESVDYGNPQIITQPPPPVQPVDTAAPEQNNLNYDLPIQPRSQVPTPPPYTPIVFPHPSSISFLNGQRRSRNSKAKVSAILVGDICDPTDLVYSKCSGNAQCVLNEGDNLYKCNCSFSYEVTSAKKCMRAWGHYCDSKDACNHEAFLSCIDNRCECENSEVYQKSPDRCRSKVGGPCSVASGPECVNNAVCLSFDTYGRISRCMCKDGFVETSSGECSPGVGMPCHGKGGCNPEIPLVCKEGVCSCREAVHAYDTETNSCVGLVGAQCCTNFDGVDCPYNVTNGCVSGAFCKKTSRTLPGRCACQSYNLESDERTCSPNPTFGQMVTGGKVY